MQQRKLLLHVTMLPIILQCMNLLYRLYQFKKGLTYNNFEIILRINKQIIFIGNVFL